MNDKKKLHNLSDLKETLVKHNIFKDYKLEKIGVFGSFARGEKFNDIDLLLTENLHYKTKEELQSKLELILGIKVDIVTEKYIDPIVKYRALKDLKYVTK